MNESYERTPDVDFIMAVITREVQEYLLSQIKAFGVAASHVWNSLPPVVTSASSLLSFKRQLKAFLFQNLFP